AGAIGVVWEVVGLDPPESLMDMYLKIMDPNTNNKVTNAIGLWARREGFDGLIYPSARYGEEKKLQQKKAEGYNLIPIINFVSVGSHLCDGFTPLLHITHAFNNEINQLGGLDNCIPVFAESNLVLFDGKQIVENRHGVVYQTFPLELRDEVLEQDDTSRQTMSYTYWSTPEKPKWL